MHERPAADGSRAVRADFVLGGFYLFGTQPFSRRWRAVELWDPDHESAAALEASVTRWTGFFRASDAAVGHGSDVAFATADGAVPGGRRSCDCGPVGAAASDCRARESDVARDRGQYHRFALLRGPRAGRHRRGVRAQRRRRRGDVEAAPGGVDALRGRPGSRGVAFSRLYYPVKVDAFRMLRSRSFACGVPWRRPVRRLRTGECKCCSVE